MFNVCTTYITFIYSHDDVSSMGVFSWFYIKWVPSFSPISGKSPSMSNFPIISFYQMKY